MNLRDVSFALVLASCAGCMARDESSYPLDVGSAAMVLVEDIAGFDGRPIRGYACTTDRGRGPLDYEFIPNGTKVRVVSDHARPPHDTPADPAYRRRGVEVLVIEGDCRDRSTTIPRAWLKPLDQ